MRPILGAKRRPNDLVNVILSRPHEEAVWHHPNASQRVSVNHRGLRVFTYRSVGETQEDVGARNRMRRVAPWLGEQAAQPARTRLDRSIEIAVEERALSLSLASFHGCKMAPRCVAVTDSVAMLGSRTTRLSVVMGVNEERSGTRDQPTQPKFSISTQPSPMGHR